MIETLRSYLSIAWVENGLYSLLLLVLFLCFVFLTRRFLNRSKMEPDRIRVVKYWATRGILLLYAIVLVRIWAFTNLFTFDDNPTFKKLLESLIAFLIVYGTIYFLRRFINSQKIDIVQKHSYRKRASYLGTMLFIIILIPIWSGNAQQWTTVLSVSGAGIALALHEMLLNIAGWIYLMIRHPYRAGHRIELGDVKGDVIDIQVFQTSLLEIGNWVDGDQSTGRVVHLPHGRLFRDTLYNYTAGFEYLWNELPVLITFESDWERAKEIILSFGEEASQEVQTQVRKKIDQMSREYLIYYRNFSPIIYTKIEDSGVKLTLRYLTEAKKRRGGEDALSRKILKAFEAEPKVEFAYPTYRIFKRGE